MKPIASFLVLFSCCCALPAQTPASGLMVAGMVNVPPLKRGLIISPMLGTGYSQALWLSEGERAGSVEVVRLSPALGEVLLRIYPANQKAEASTPATNVVLTLPSSAASSALPTLVLQDAPFVAVLELYAQLSQRTLLRHPALRPTPINLRYAVTNAMEAALALEQSLASNHVALVLDGVRFVRVVPEAYAERERASVSATKPAGDSFGPPFFKTGEMVFTGAELGMLARSYYAGFQNRQLVDVDAAWFQSAAKFPVFLSNQTPLNRVELIHAFDIIFAWQGVKFELVGDKFIKPVPLRSK